MAEIDLFKPEISQVVKGIDGKILLIYGCNKCGKTYNAVQAPKPLVLAFEQGLGALDGVPFFPIRTWSEFRSIVRKLSDPKNFDALHEKYNTIIVDAIDGIEKLSDRYVCSSLGINHIREYNGGYGAWKEWGDEIESQLRPLAFSGFTVIFIGHEGTRKFLAEDGKTEYEMVYPRGDKRVVDPILNYVDLTCYVRLGGAKDTGDQELSTLYLKATVASSPAAVSRKSVRPSANGPTPILRKLWSKPLSAAKRRAGSKPSPMPKRVRWKSPKKRRKKHKSSRFPCW